MFRHMVFVCFLAAACYFDGHGDRIPNRLLLAMAGAGVLSGVLAGVSVGHLVIGFVLPFAALLPLYLMRALGAGDVKLLCAAGVYAGSDCIKLLATSLLLAGLAGVCLLLRRRLLKRRLCESLLYFWVLFCSRRAVPYRYGIGHPQAVTIPFAWCVLAASMILFVAAQR